jgi:hypothetical protein
VEQFKSSTSLVITGVAQYQIMIDTITGRYSISAISYDNKMNQIYIQTYIAYQQNAIIFKESYLHPT